MRTSSTRASINCALRRRLPPCSSALRTWLQQARNCARRLLPPATSCDLHRATRPWCRLLRAGSRRRRVCPRRRLLRGGSLRRCVRLARRLLLRPFDTPWSFTHTHNSCCVHGHVVAPSHACVRTEGQPCLLLAHYTSRNEYVCRQAPRCTMCCSKGFVFMWGVSFEFLWHRIRNLLGHDSPRPVKFQTTLATPQCNRTVNRPCVRSRAQRGRPTVGSCEKEPPIQAVRRF